jgi:hypothetical protein
MFKTVIVLCIVAYQQCALVEHPVDSSKLYRSEQVCEAAADKMADAVINELNENGAPQFFVRYGCEKVEAI